VQRNALQFAQEWLRTNSILPSGVEADEEQFKQVMDTVLKGLLLAYLAGAGYGKSVL
jgi:hypothetical protein